MRILLCSVPFAPSVGGTETVSRVLADEFTRGGHEVVVVTQTLSAAPVEAPYPILRRPNARSLARAYASAEAVLHNNVSLRLGWPLLLSGRKPWVIAHHVWTPRHGRGGVAGRAKHYAARRARNIAVSTAIARALDVPSVIVPNPYDSSLFREDRSVARTRDLVFLGRLVSDKGAAVLIAALGGLARIGRRPTLTIIGEGPERFALEATAERLGVGQAVRFAGTLRGAELVRALNAHRVLVVPSVWEEPFGVVALEGLACGLVPIVARSGGLPDAVGACGIVVPKGDAGALGTAIVAALDDEVLRARLAAQRAQHLARHEPASVACAYLSELEAAVRGIGRGIPGTVDPRSRADAGRR